MTFYSAPMSHQERARTAAMQMVKRGLAGLTDDEIAAVVARAVLSDRGADRAQSIADRVSREVWLGVRHAHQK